VKVERFAFHHSKVFDRDYLVAFVSRQAFRAANPDSDASAAAMTNPKLPPVVIMPERHCYRGASALSIIEHEIVHINQMLTGAFPALPKERDVHTRIKFFADAMRTEYEPNLLQLVRWPALYPTDVGLSLDHCAGCADPQLRWKRRCD
jgi:hypothetical protein